MRSSTRVVVGSIALFTIVALLASPSSAFAHAELESSIPESGSALAQFPEQIELVFSEPIDSTLLTLSLLSADGQELPLIIETDLDGPEIALTAMRDPGSTLSPGVYTVVWRVLSTVDGHITTGTIAFSVGTGERPAVTGTDGANRPPWWHVLGRWIELAGWVTMAGLSMFGALHGRVVLSGQSASFIDRIIDRWRNGWLLASGFAIFGMIVSLWAQTVRVSGAEARALPSAGNVAHVLGDSSYGLGWLTRLMLVAVSMALIGFAPGLRNHWQWWALALLMIAGLGTFSFTGHAAAEPGRLVAIGTDWLHLTAVTVWLGGLVGLIIAVWVLRHARDVAAAGLGVTLVSRHSKISMAAMAVIVVTGIVSSSLHVGGFQSLRNTHYGVTLLLKQGLLVIVVAAAAVNLLVLRPRMRVFIEAEHCSETTRSLAGFRSIAIFEAVVAVMILLASATLTLVKPADYPLVLNVATRAMSISQERNADDLNLTLTSMLRGDETDEFRVEIRQDGSPRVEGIQRIIVETSFAGGDITTTGVGDRFDAEPVGAEGNGFAFSASRLGLEGPWDVQIIVRRAGMDDVLAAFNVDTTGAAWPPLRLVDDSWQVPRLTLATWSYLVLAVVMLVIGLAGMRRLTNLEPVASGVLLALCILIAAGFVVSGARQTVPVTPDSAIANPVAADDVSIRTGADLFTANCMLCHGVDGHGVDVDDEFHGHGGTADLNRRNSVLQSDGDLHYRIAEGVPGTEMPAYGEALDDEEIWNLVNYVRWLQELESDESGE
ncbi:hypothetical protein BH23CHL5_BH23CHL5_27390 [soil metagenome]